VRTEEEIEEYIKGLIELRSESKDMETKALGKGWYAAADGLRRGAEIYQREIGVSRWVLMRREE
jgi:hypothetical protein